MLLWPCQPSVLLQNTILSEVIQSAMRVLAVVRAVTLRVVWLADEC